MVMSLETQQQTPQNWGACNCQHTGIRSRPGCCIDRYRLPEVKLASRQIAIAPQDAVLNSQGIRHLA